MKLFSIDIETSGLDPENNQILEFGCVYVDTDSPDLRRRFVRRIYHEEIVGGAFALNMNSRLIAALVEDNKVYDPEEIEQWQPRPNIDEEIAAIDEHELFWQFEAFVRGCVPEGKINVVGKNFSGFDLPFLMTSDPRWETLLRRRVIDPAILYVNPDDEKLPNLTQCMERADGTEPTAHHSALADAEDTLNLVVPYFLRMAGGVPAVS